MALLLPLARTILKYALFYHGTGHLQKILNIAYFDAFDESEYPTLSGLHTPDELRADFHRRFGGFEPEYHSYYLRNGKLCLIAGQYEDYMSDTDSWAHGRRPFVMETDTGKSK